MERWPGQGNAATSEARCLAHRWRDLAYWHFDPGRPQWYRKLADTTRSWLKNVRGQTLHPYPPDEASASTDAERQLARDWKWVEEHEPGRLGLALRTGNQRWALNFVVEWLFTGKAHVEEEGDGGQGAKEQEQEQKACSLHIPAE